MRRSNVFLAVVAATAAAVATAVEASAAGAGAPEFRMDSEKDAAVGSPPLSTVYWQCTFGKES